MLRLTQKTKAQTAMAVRLIILFRLFLSSLPIPRISLWLHYTVSGLYKRLYFERISAKNIVLCLKSKIFVLLEATNKSRGLMAAASCQIF